MMTFWCLRRHTWSSNVHVFLTVFITCDPLIQLDASVDTWRVTKQILVFNLSWRQGSSMKMVLSKHFSCNVMLMIHDDSHTFCTFFYVVQIQLCPSSLYVIRRKLFLNLKLWDFAKGHVFKSYYVFEGVLLSLNALLRSTGWSGKVSLICLSRLSK